MEGAGVAQKPDPSWGSRRRPSNRAGAILPEEPPGRESGAAAERGKRDGKRRRKCKQPLLLQPAGPRGPRTHRADVQLQDAEQRLPRHGRGGHREGTRRLPARSASAAPRGRRRCHGNRGTSGPHYACVAHHPPPRLRFLPTMPRAGGHCPSHDGVVSCLCLILSHPPPLRPGSPQGPPSSAPLQLRRRCPSSCPSQAGPWA